MPHRLDGEHLPAAIHALAAKSDLLHEVHLKAGATRRESEANWQPLAHSGVVSQHSFALRAPRPPAVVFDRVHFQFLFLPGTTAIPARRNESTTRHATLQAFILSFLQCVVVVRVTRQNISCWRGVLSGSPPLRWSRRPIRLRTSHRDGCAACAGLAWQGVCGPGVSGQRERLPTRQRASYALGHRPSGQVSAASKLFASMKHLQS